MAERPTPIRPTPTRHTRIREVPIGQVANNGDMLVGYRFAFAEQGDIPDWTQVVRGATGLTFVVKGMPVAGPIFMKCWYGDRTLRWWAVCIGCNANSKSYKIRHSGIRLWAALHRCRRRLELAGIVEQEEVDS